MIIKARPLNPFFFRCGAILIRLFLGRRFKKMSIRAVDVKPGCSYILMCNHFSFLDGLLAYYLCDQIFWGKGKMKKLYIMSLKKQMQKNKWLRYCGSFSVDPGKRSIKESFAYAAEVLSVPGNLLLFYPQGKLESHYIQQIQFEEGLSEIVPRVKAPCQLVWSSNLFEFFESTKPTVYFDLLDCGTSETFDFEALQKKVNLHHRAAIASQIRFTQETL